MTRLGIDEYGLAVAAVVARRAACTRRQAGAVIIGPDKRIVATGYNGTAPGAVECTDGGCPRGAFSYEEIPPLLGNAGHAVPCVASHAERNAIDWMLQVVPRDLRVYWDHTLYVSSRPCPDCRELATGLGLRVVFQPERAEAA